jgi:hypothetical protein
MVLISEPGPGFGSVIAHSTPPLMTATPTPSKLGRQFAARCASGDADPPERMEKTERASVTKTEESIVEEN